MNQYTLSPLCLVPALCLATYAVSCASYRHLIISTQSDNQLARSRMTNPSSQQCVDVERDLQAGPQLRGDTPPMLVLLISWITRLITNLLAHVNYFMGNNTDQIHHLQDRIDALEAHAASQPAAPPPIPQQPARPSRSTRCQRCHANGHDTSECRTKDPVSVKNRIAKNQKAKKAVAQPPPVMYPPYPGFVPYPHQQPPQPSSYQAIAALAVDANELRRRRVQSSRDKRRKAVPSTSS